MEKRVAARFSTPSPLDFLRDRVAFLETQVAILQKHLRRDGREPRYTLRERLWILWQMEYFQIPRRRVTEYFGVARSTFYRWLHWIDDETSAAHASANKTPVEIAALVWEIAKTNITWGRVRIAQQLRFLNVFLSASTVRCLLNRPRPRAAPPIGGKSEMEAVQEKPPIPAWYPNHVWSLDTTEVLRWGLWPTHVLVVIDHFSRKIVCAAPLEGPNAGWVIEALGQTFERFGAPKHIISDRGPVFIGDAFAALLKAWDVNPRLGAVGKHGSIAVTERAIETLKYEWLKRVPLIRGFDHLTALCESFTGWYNAWRPHTTLDGRTPDQVYFRMPISPISTNLNLDKSVHSR